MAVVADSPQFSALVAQTAPVATKGTALTMVNCLGFSITLISLQFFNLLTLYLPPEYLFTLLGLGPGLGLLQLHRLIKNQESFLH